MPAPPDLALRAAPETPADAGLAALADRCVQCGLCLPHCPTYRLDQSEAESPRGRIAYIKAVARGQLAPTAAGDAHLDHCLGCRRCEPVCPAGVPYGELLLGARAAQAARRPAAMKLRAAGWLLARPPLLGRLVDLQRATRWLPASLRPSLPPAPARVALPAPPAAAVQELAVFVGCIADRYESGTRAALARLLGAAGIAVSLPGGQGCCGAAAVEDAITTLDRLGDRLRFRAARHRVALHLPCTQRSVVRSDAALRRLLARVPGLDVVELPDTGCCGAAGLHQLAEPGRADALRAPLLQALAGTGARELLSANIGCRLHLANGAIMPVRHPIDFLAEHLA